MSEPVEPSAEASEPERIPATEEACNLLDCLHLHLWHLVEDQTAQKLQLSRETSDARLILARIRLQEGHQRMSAEAQLLRWRPHKALCRLVEEARPSDQTPPIGSRAQPVTNIFGPLMPVSLRMASRKWDRCVHQIVACANIHGRHEATQEVSPRYSQVSP